MMSTMEQNARHLREVAHPSNNRYCLHSSNDTSTLHAVNRTAMGGMVSAISAVLCGTRQYPEADKIHDNAPTSKPDNSYHTMNGNSLIHTSTAEITLGKSHTSRHSDEKPEQTFTNLECQIPYDTRNQTLDRSNSLNLDHVGLSKESPEFVRQHLDIPYMDEDSDRSQLSISTTSLNSPRDKLDQMADAFIADNHEATKSLDKDKNCMEEVVVVSEAEYSADEEQEELDSDQYETDNEERIIYETDDEESADEHVCNSDCEHSEYEMEDESEAGSVDEEHVCDSECDHSEGESGAESEYESEELESDVEDPDDDLEEVIEISENELSCDEEQQSEYEEVVNCECDSNCPSDCDGEHHECSSQCGCDQYQTDSENEQEVGISRSDSDESQTGKTLVNGTNNNPALPVRRNTKKFSLPAKMEILSEISTQSKSSLNSPERNNNWLQRNHSQRIPHHSNGDMLGELKTAIDARIRRSASCRETTSDYRKRYAHLSHQSNDDSAISENISKLDVKDREVRRKERRSRLRTLELKREQCLEEVRDGIEENVTDRVYRASHHE